MLAIGIEGFFCHLDGRSLEFVDQWQQRNLPGVGDCQHTARAGNFSGKAGRIIKAASSWTSESKDRALGQLSG